MDEQKPIETYTVPPTETPALDEAMEAKEAFAQSVIADSAASQSSELITGAPGVVAGEGFKDPNETVKEIQAQLAERAVDGTIPVVQPGAQGGLTRKE